MEMRLFLLAAETCLEELEWDQKNYDSIRDTRIKPNEKPTQAVLNSPYVDVTVLVDSEEQLVLSKSKQLRVREVHDHRDTLDQEIVDAVSIATSNSLPLPTGKDSLNVDIHTFTERQFTTRLRS